MATGISSVLMTRRSLTATVLIGIGFMAAIDEIIFHQLLAWHHFVDRGTGVFALLSDGVLHSAELILLILGFFMLAELREHKAFAKPYGQAGFFLGMGGFQLFDGIIDHKVLRLHQVRYVDNLLVYDVMWNLAGGILLLIGILLLRNARRIYVSS
ncbi:putative membrane protein [Pseudomonas duriflava]|uniref:Putative membrane protein n=1 Tax=Pseudomonas duriflava TaxID=459528 RepID=A0A562Q6T2_9PSED|nr:DUF2243 domain-containing protein [Pseudomonas duriflava]TWI52471.1 putative membrane protein [Pseudomonas duriflava]